MHPELLILRLNCGVERKYRPVLSQKNAKQLQRDVCGVLMTTNVVNKR